jgi:hypothetical protein
MHASTPPWYCFTVWPAVFFFWIESDNLVPAANRIFFGLAILERRVSLFFAPVVAVYFLALLLLPFGKPPGLRWRNILIMVLPALAFAGYELLSAGYVASFFTKIVGHQHDPLRVLCLWSTIWACRFS